MPEKPKKRKQVWQGHHITYADGRKHPPTEWVVQVTQGEHYLITQLQRFKSLSPGAVQALLYEISQMPTRKPDA